MPQRMYGRWVGGAFASVRASHTNLNGDGLYARNAAWRVANGGRGMAAGLTCHQPARSTCLHRFYYRHLPMVVSLPASIVLEQRADLALSLKPLFPE